jgi:hypothetical protein
MTIVVLEPSEEFPRRLTVDGMPSTYHVSIRSPHTPSASIAFWCCSKDEISIYRDGQRQHYLVAGFTQAPISEKEAERLVATFKIEVQS